MIDRREFTAFVGGGLAMLLNRCGLGGDGDGPGGPAPTPEYMAQLARQKDGAIDPARARAAWRRVPIYGGGFVTGMDFSADGKRMIHWADVFNGYIRNHGDPEWRLLLRRDNLRRAEHDPRPRTPTTDIGVFAARIAPSNRDVIYVSWNGFIFRTGDGGASFVRTALAPRRMQSNMGPQRRFNRALDVHRDDADQVIAGTNNDGVHATTDGGRSWFAIDVPPAAKTANAEGKYLVGFGPGGLVYVHVPGAGLFRSDSGPKGRFAPVGGPVSASCLVITPRGTIYLCEYPAGRPRSGDLVKRFDGREWTALACAADQIAVDPFDENHLFAVGEDLLGRSPLIRRSTDGGRSWTSHQFTRGTGEVSWLSSRNKASFPAQVLFDPVERGKLWMADGVGVTWSRVPEPGEVWTLHDHSAGNAELAPVSTVSIPGAPPVMCFWDKPFWRIDDDRGPTNTWSYPVPAGQSFTQNMVTVGYGVDYAPEDPSFLVGVAGQGRSQNGWSADGGRTWTEFATQPAAPYRFGGAVAVASRRNFILTSANNGSGAFTLDGGESWQPISFGGHNPVIGWNSAYYINRLNIAADKTRPGTFAAVVHNITKNAAGRDALGRDIAGLWLTRDGGRSWERRLAGVIQGSEGSQAQFWQCRLRYVPGRAGELVFADGDGNPGNRLMWSRDDGATWQALGSAVRNVSSFGFGRAVRAGDRPAVFFHGTVGGKRGVYASFDWFATPPMLLASAPLDTISEIADVTGDLNIVGRCYAMLAGNGATVCDLVPRDG